MKLPIEIDPKHPILINSKADESDEMGRALTHVFGGEDFFVESVSPTIYKSPEDGNILTIARVRDADNELHLMYFMKRDGMSVGYRLPSDVVRGSAVYSQVPNIVYPTAKPRPDEKTTVSAPVTIEANVDDAQPDGLLESALTANAKSVDSISESASTLRMQRELEDETSQYDAQSKALEDMIKNEPPPPPAPPQPKRKKAPPKKGASKGKQKAAAEDR